MDAHSYTFQTAGSVIASANLAHLGFTINLIDFVDTFVMLDKVRHRCDFLSRQLPESNQRYDVTLLCQLLETEIEGLVIQWADLDNFYSLDHPDNAVIKEVMKSWETKANHPEYENNLANNVSSSQSRDGAPGARINNPPRSQNSRMKVERNQLRIRSKRQIAAILAGVLAGVGGSLLFSWLDGSRMNQVVDAVNGLSKAQGQIVHVLNRHSKEIAWNRKGLKDLASAVLHINNLLQLNAAELRAQAATLSVRSLIARVRSRLELLANAVTAANQGKLAPGIISWKAAQAALDDIRIRARKFGLEPILVSPQQFHQLPCSFVREKHGLTLVVHVFLSRPAQVFRLFRYQGFPIQFENDIEAIIRPEKTFYATSASPNQVDKRENLYFELSSDELEVCHKFQGTFVCPQIVVFRKGMRESTCLHALFSSNAKSSLSECSIFIRPSKNTVIRIGLNKFVQYSKTPSTYSEVCHSNGTVRPDLQLSTLSEVSVDPGCYLELPDFRLEAETEIYVTSHVRSYMWRVSTADLFQHLDEQEIKGTLTRLRELKGAPEVSLNTIKAYHAVISPVSWSAILTYVALIVGGLGFLILIIFVAYSVRLARKEEARPKLIPRYVTQCGQCQNTAKWTGLAHDRTSGGTVSFVNPN